MLEVSADSASRSRAAAWQPRKRTAASVRFRRRPDARLLLRLPVPPHPWREHIPQVCGPIQSVSRLHSRSRKRVTIQSNMGSSSRNARPANATFTNRRSVARLRKLRRTRCSRHRIRQQRSTDLVMFQEATKASSERRVIALLANHQSMSDDRAPSARHPFGIKWAIRSLINAKKTIAKCLLASLLLATVYLLLAKPSYTAAGSIVIDLREPRAFSESPIWQMLGTETYAINSQAEIIQSRRVVSEALKAVNIPKKESWSLRRLLGGVSLLINGLVGRKRPR